MPSASSSRYQSRLFNFVHRQSRRLGDRIDRTFRHIQVATSWSLEALVYPVFLLMQKAVELAGKQLHAQDAQSRLQLEGNNQNSQPETPPAVDTPIQRVLQAVENLPSEEATKTEPLKRFAFLWFKPFQKHSSGNSLTHSSPVTDTPKPDDTLKRHHPTVRGIATQLVNRHLVLVTAENEIIDILTRQQQEKLQDRIIGEVADYWHSWQLATVKKETELLPEIDRLLTKLTSGNAKKMPALPQEIATEESIESVSLVNREEVLAFLDASVAKLESNALTPLSRAKLTVQQRSREIIEVVQTQLDVILYGKELTVAANDIKSDRFQIQAIIEAALNYFFGQRTGKKLDSSPPANVSQSLPISALPVTRQLQNQELIADPWLSWGDLFGDFEPMVEEEVASPTTNPALPANESTINPQNWINSYQKFVKKSKPGSGLVQRQEPTTDLTRTHKASAKVTVTKRSESQISPPGNENNKGEIAENQHFSTTDIEAKPDWIETKATSIGYEKHPLERILEWLDAALLWLEEMFVKLFKALQQFWVGK